MLTHGNMTIYRYLIKQAKIYKNKEFICFEDQVISYEQMYKKSMQVANWLLQQGVKKGDKISLMVNNSPTFYDFWFGCGAIGAVIVPINTASKSSELKYFLDHSESVGIIYHSSVTDETHLQVIEEANILFASAADDTLEQQLVAMDSHLGHHRVSADDLSSIMYTSGTTSKPKGVMITHENYLYSGHSSTLYQQLTPEDRFLIFLPLFHVNAQYYSSMATFVAGGTIILLERFKASTFWETVDRFKPTVTSFVATTIKILLQLEESPYEKTQTIKQAGYGLFVTNQDVIQFRKRFNLKLYQWFGMTESITTNITTPLYSEMAIDAETGILAIGKSGLGQEVKIIHDTGRLCDFGEVGQIIIKSPSLMKGYYKNDVETQKTIRDGWLYTGDNGYMNEEGFIWFVDRGKDLIKRAGENISSIEIENVLLEIPQVSSCAVIGVPDHIREEKVIAFVQVAEEISKQLILDYCKKKLSYFKIPEEVHFVQQFTRTSIGKIQKNILKDEYLNRSPLK